MTAGLGSCPGPVSVALRDGVATRTAKLRPAHRLILRGPREKNETGKEAKARQTAKIGGGKY